MVKETGVKTYDERPCTLGEGALWHPERQQLFWFDILGNTLMTLNDEGVADQWHFDEHVSAAGWIDRDTLLIASESGLYRFDIDTGAREPVCPLEADNPVTRSNDGRADPRGGFWIGTMGKAAEPNAGAIYRYYRGELRRLIAPLTIPNAICFSPEGRYGYFADTAKGAIWRVELDGESGWPAGEPELFIDCRREGVNPDGAVVDSEGRLWNAQWGASRIACYDPDGQFVTAIAFPTEQISCPAFGGADFSRLFATSAREGMSAEELSDQPKAGCTFVIGTEVSGRAEPRVFL
ncbi:SMP-30/gluconolactonase/LRE family protein [Marinobacterium sp. D7]|uniref:SMP-30/gluconolactonase/LRE family protein n=1 Tax=Marinobacterium ramblicola TaxID=2849041 RepID=UPI001C2D14A9|nr:SMP-30/gluconolactonase/LRE family protein [Marinobacterium ramblicola]MBV1787642.1 SMP-30/gluconolactonase/LRE family protein [Marinobacterium ramblicola]